MQALFAEYSGIIWVKIRHITATMSTGLLYGGLSGPPWDNSLIEIVKFFGLSFLFRLYLGIKEKNITEK